MSPFKIIVLFHTMYRQPFLPLKVQILRHSHVCSNEAHWLSIMFSERLTDFKTLVKKSVYFSRIRNFCQSLLFFWNLMTDFIFQISKSLSKYQLLKLSNAVRQYMFFSLLSNETLASILNNYLKLLELQGQLCFNCAFLFRSLTIFESIAFLNNN